MIPRIAEDELEPRLAAALRPRVERLGYLGEFFRCAAHVPDALLAFIEFTDAAKGDLPSRLVELVALTASVRAGSEYERNQHERLAIRLGLARDWVEAVTRCTPEILATTEEQAVQRYVLAALARLGRDTESEIEAMARLIGPAGAVAVMMLTGRYLVHALFVNGLRLAPPVPSIFEDGFGLE
jgi:alkylhydroperoxidase family enzyme